MTLNFALFSYLKMTIASLNVAKKLIDGLLKTGGSISERNRYTRKFQCPC